MVKPQGHVMSMRCEQPLDELTVQVCLLYHHPNLKYCSLYESGTKLQTDRQTFCLLDVLGKPFRPRLKIVTILIMLVLIEDVCSSNG